MKIDFSKPNVVDFSKPNVVDFSKLLDMMADFYAIDNYPFERNISEKNLHQFTNQKEIGELWLIRTEDDMVGYIILVYGFSFEFGGKSAFVDELYIKEKYRGKGFGKQSMEFIDIRAKMLDLKVLYLEMEVHNQNAANLYYSAGFYNKGRALLSKKFE